jgi:triosephosphate isomerase
MLVDFGCRYVIVGHSERRAYHLRKQRTGGAENAWPHWLPA